jgi:hypothetical protein
MEDLKKNERGYGDEYYNLYSKKVRGRKSDYYEKPSSRRNGCDRFDEDEWEYEEDNYGSINYLNDGVCARGL